MSCYKIKQLVNISEIVKRPVLPAPPPPTGMMFSQT